MTIHGARLLKSLNIIITSWKWKIKKKIGAPQIKCIDVAKQGKIHCEKKKKKNNFIAFYFAVCCFAA